MSNATRRRIGVETVRTIDAYNPHGPWTLELSCLPREMPAIAAWLPAWIAKVEGAYIGPTVSPAGLINVMRDGYVWTPAAWAANNAYHERAESYRRKRQEAAR